MVIFHMFSATHQNEFEAILQIFHILGGEGARGVNQLMENSICFLQILFESFPKFERQKASIHIQQGIPFKILTQEKYSSLTLKQITKLQILFSL